MSLRFPPELRLRWQGLHPGEGSCGLVLRGCRAFCEVGPHGSSRETLPAATKVAWYVRRSTDLNLTRARPHRSPVSAVLQERFVDSLVTPVLFTYQHLGLWCSVRHITMHCEGKLRAGGGNLALKRPERFCLMPLILTSVIQPVAKTSVMTKDRAAPLSKVERSQIHEGRGCSLEEMERRFPVPRAWVTHSHRTGALDRFPSCPQGGYPCSSPASRTACPSLSLFAVCLCSCPPSALRGFRIFPIITWPRRYHASLLSC